MASTNTQPAPRTSGPEPLPFAQRRQTFESRLRRRNIFKEVATAKVAAMRQAQSPKDSAHLPGTGINTPRKCKLRMPKPRQESPEYINSESEVMGPRSTTKTKNFRIIGYIPKGFKLVGVVMFNIFRIMCILDDKEVHSSQQLPDQDPSYHKAPQKEALTRKLRRNGTWGKGFRSKLD